LAAALDFVLSFGDRGEQYEQSHLSLLTSLLELRSELRPTVHLYDWRFDNGHMERSHRTHNEEFCEVMAASDQLPTSNRQLLGWEHTCNCVRPHQALGYLTRLEFVKRWKRSVQNQRCH
jgi:hypothetical protein